VIYEGGNYYFTPSPFGGFVLLWHLVYLIDLKPYLADGIKKTYDFVGYLFVFWWLG
jgi:hypothetical protein